MKHHINILAKVITLFFTLSISICSYATSDSDTLWKWPVAGKQAGDGILFKPQQYIDKELNFDDLFIGAEYGTIVVAPCNGVLDFFSVGSKTSINTGTSWGHDNGETLNANIEAVRTEGVQGPLTGSVTISVGNGIQVHISGLEGDVPMKTGMKIRKGDILGTVGYAYKAIKEPCISVSVSKYSKPWDPMTPFGLKTTFVAPGKLVIPKVLTSQQALEDYEVLMAAFQEAYPSLYDVASQEQLTAMDSVIRKRLSTDISYEDFLYEVIAKIKTVVHDGHISLLDAHYDNDINVPYPHIYPGTIGDSLLVTRVMQGYEQYLKKRIVSIDGIPAEDLIESVKSGITSYDLQNKSKPERWVAKAWNWYYGNIDKWGKGKTAEIVFADGEVFRDEFVPGSMIVKKGLTPAMNDKEVNSVYRQYFKYRGNPYIFETLNDSTMYLGISSFQLNEIQMESIADSLSRHIDVPNIIIDMRNNPGGNVLVVNEMLGWFLNEPSKDLDSYAFVNKKGGFESFEYSMNYTSDMEFFPEFSEVEGKDGYYLSKEAEDKIMPDSTLNYKGRIYVLTDETSVSAASLFPSVLVRNHRAVTVGRETASGYHFMTALKFADIRLPNSFITVRIPLVKEVFDETVTERTPLGRGLLPDYEVPLTYEELFTAKEDVVLNAALALIAEGKYLGEDPFAEIDNPVPDFDIRRIALICGISLIILLAIIGIVTKLRKKA